MSSSKPGNWKNIDHLLEVHGSTKSQVLYHTSNRISEVGYNWVGWNHCLRTHCKKNFKGWIAGFNPFCQLIEIRTLGWSGILATGSCSPLTGINIPKMIKYCFFRPGWTDTWAGTSNSCIADKENSRKAKAETMYVPRSARCPVGIAIPTARLLGWRSINWAIDSLALLSANLLCNVLTYFFYGCEAANPFLHVLARVLFSPRCLCFGWLLCFGFAACRAVSGDTIST